MTDATNERLSQLTRALGFDSEAAQREGWDVFDCGVYPPPDGVEWPAQATGRQRVEIQRYDEAGVFETDADAICFVISKARQGYHNHRTALLIVDEIDPYASAWVGECAHRQLIERPVEVLRSDPRVHFWRTMLAFLCTIVFVGMLLGYAMAWTLVGWSQLNEGSWQIPALALLLCVPILRLTSLNHNPAATWADLLPRWIVRMWNQ